MKTVAVIAAYNEEDRIVESINDASAFVDAVVVVDDCSTDRTRHRAASTGVHVLHHLINRGQGAALQTGMDYALQKLQADIIVHFDADGQMQGSDIPALLEPIVSGAFEIALGSRFLGRAEQIPVHRRLLLKLAIVFTFLTSGLWLSDTHNGFRALSAKAARTLHITLDRMAHATELIEQMAVYRLSFLEVPVTIRYSARTLAKGQKSSALVHIALDILKDKIL